jgi:hypothetical protein
MKCNKTQSKWCINKHGASKIIDMFETYQPQQMCCCQGWYLWCPPSNPCPSRNYALHHLLYESCFLPSVQPSLIWNYLCARFRRGNSHGLGSLLVQSLWDSTLQSCSLYWPRLYLRPVAFLFFQCLCSLRSCWYFELSSFVSFVW